MDIPRTSLITRAQIEQEKGEPEEIKSGTEEGQEKRDERRED